LCRIDSVYVMPMRLVMAVLVLLIMGSHLDSVLASMNDVKFYSLTNISTYQTRQNDYDGKRNNIAQLNNSSEHLFCDFDYSQSGTNLPTFHKEISYNQNESNVLKTRILTNYKEVLILDLPHFKKLLNAVCNDTVFTSNHDFQNPECNDCIQNNLTVTLNKQPHFLIWTSPNTNDNEQHRFIPSIVKDFVNTLLNICNC
jgi:hypothetical protein